MLETPQFTLIPLSAGELELWLEELSALEKKLELCYRGDPLAGALESMARGQLVKLRQDRENQLFHTLWLLLRREDRVVVGSAGFKGPPRDSGEVELGYGIHRDYWGRGYATQAARALCVWALEQPGVKRVVAATRQDNIASQRVLQKCGMRKTRESKNGEIHWWAIACEDELSPSSQTNA